MTILVAVLDDEPLARRRLERLIAREPDLALAGSYEHPLDARVSMGDVDLLLLDIEMPGGSGFDLLRALPAERLPYVIVVTAHGRHALPAFEHAALDFLLKPYDDASFARAIARARERLQADAALAQQKAASTSSPSSTPPTSLEAAPLALRVIEGDGERLLQPAEVAWLRADGRGVLLHACGRTWRAHGRLADYEARLAPLGFLRVHRGTLVNLALARACRPLGHGDRELALEGGQVVRVSRRYAPALEVRLL